MQQWQRTRCAGYRLAVRLAINIPAMKMKESVKIARTSS
jgi:hypothetical protein